MEVLGGRWTINHDYGFEESRLNNDGCACAIGSYLCTHLRGQMDLWDAVML